MAKYQYKEEAASEGRPSRQTHLATTDAFAEIMFL